MKAQQRQNPNGSGLNVGRYRLILTMMVRDIRKDFGFNFILFRYQNCLNFIY